MQASMDAQRNIRQADQRSIKWADIEAQFIELDGKLSEREGSRMGGVRLLGERRVFHAPTRHPTQTRVRCQVFAGG